MKKLKLLVIAALVAGGITVAYKVPSYADTLGSSALPDMDSTNVTQSVNPNSMPVSFYRNNEGISENFYNYNIPGATKVRYGTSGEGRPLYYYKIGNGDKTIIANFEIHGFEDSWSQDGYQLTRIAHKTIEDLVKKNNEHKLNGWSVIVIPAANPDGILDGYTNNGPGRAQISKKIDLNRDFPTYFKPEYSSRNYTGSTPLQAPEAKALANLVETQSRENKDLVLLDTHGWLDMTVGDPSIGKYFINHLGLDGNRGYVPAGHGYFVSYGHAEGAEVSLVELPMVYSQSQVDRENLQGKYFDALMDLINHGTPMQFMNKNGVVVNTGGVNLKIRSGATTDGYILGSLPEGSEVKIVGKINGWYKIYKEGIGYAYVSGDYIKITGDSSNTPKPENKPTENPTPENKPTQATTIGKTTIQSSIGWLHFRTSNSTSASIIDKIPTGTTVDVLGQSNGWYKVKYNGREGWISSSYTTGLQSINNNNNNNNNNHNNNQNNNQNNNNGQASQKTTIQSSIGWLHFRTSNSTSASIIDKIPTGTTVDVLGQSNGWYKVKYNGREGWISSSYTTGLQSINNNNNTNNNHNNNNHNNNNNNNQNNNNGQASQKTTIQSSIGWLHFRTGNSTSASIIDKIPTGTTVDVLGQSNGWYKVKYNGREGWISSSYTTGLNSNNTSQAKKTTIQSSIGWLHFRTGNSTSASIIDKIPTGTTVDVLGQSNGWYKVKYNGREGWISSSYTTGL